MDLATPGVDLPELDVFDPACDLGLPGLHLIRAHNVPVGTVVLPLDVDARWAAIEAELGPAIARHRCGDGIEARGEPHSADTCRWAADVPRLSWSVIIATRNRPDLLQRCVRSIAASRPNVEIIVVDNGSSDPRANRDAVDREHPNVMLLHESIPGASRARNCGLAIASGDLIAFTDDDVVVDEHWFLAFERRLAEEPDLGAVCGLVVPASLNSRAARHFEQFGGFNKGSMPRSFDLRDHRPESAMFPWAAGQFGSGNNVVFRAEVIRDIGGFDILLGPGTPTRAGEDLDLLVRTILAGHRLGYEPTAMVWHRHRTDAEALTTQIHDYGVGLSAMVARQIARSPRHSLSIAKAFPSGIRHLIGSGSSRNANREEGYPSHLSRAELSGVVRGPAALLASHRLERRRQQSLGHGDGPGGTRELSRSTRSLLVNTFATGLLGVAFWAVAARSYAASQVGRASALISAMTLVSAIGQLNLQQGIPRLLPTLARGGRAFVLRCYAAALAATLVASAVAVALLTRSRSSPLLHSSGESALFISAALIWTVFTLQDAGLVALRASQWVPVENIAFAIAKIVLAIALADVAVRNGLLLAWMIPVGVAVIPVSWLLFRRLLPAHTANFERLNGAAVEPRQRPARRQRGFLAADYAGQIVNLGATTAMPLIVALRVGTTSAAYFAASWMMTAIAEQVLGAVTTPLVVEATRRPDSTPLLTRHALRLLAMTLFPALLVAITIAPKALGLLGHDYEHAAPLLRFICIGLLGRAIVMVRLAHLRLARARVQVITLGCISACGLLVGSLLTLGRFGIVGVGFSYAVTQVGLALWASVGIARTLRKPMTITRSHRRALTALDREAAALLDESFDREAAALLEATPATSRRARSSLPEWLLFIAAIGAFTAGLAMTDVDKINDLGLLPALGWPYFVGLALWVAAFACALRHRKPRLAPIVALLVMLVVVLHGLPGIVESMPRYFSAYLHVGFIEHIGRTHTIATDYDARFSWWSFFAWGSTVAGAGGDPRALWMVRFALVAFNLIYIAGVAALANVATADRRIRAIACALFVATNWFAQDYLSPQALGLVLWLAIIVVAVRVFPMVGRRVGGGAIATLWHEFRGRHVDSSVPRVGQHVRATMVVIVAAMTLILATGHQLSPVMVITAAGALVFFGRTELKVLPVLAVLSMIGWLSFGAEGFWVGHLSYIFGGVGSVGSNVSSGVTNRLVALSPQRELVLGIRLLLEATVTLTALACWIREWRRGRRHTTLVILLLSPWSVILAQSYGGEGFLRAGLFSLPAAVALIAAGTAPQRWHAGERGEPDDLEATAPPAVAAVTGNRFRPRASAILLAVTLALAPVLGAVFVTARFGNESSEIVRPEELAAVRWVYMNAPLGSTLLATSRNLPWRFEHLLDYNYYPLGDEFISDPTSSEHVVTVRGHDTYLMLSHGQDVFGTTIYGFPPGWTARLREEIKVSGRWTLVFGEKQAEVWKLAPPTAATKTQETKHTTSNADTTAAQIAAGKGQP